MAAYRNGTHKFAPIVLHIGARYVVVDTAELAVERAREAWQCGGDLASEWIGVHQAFLDAIESGDRDRLHKAIRRFMSAAHASGWLETHPMLGSNGHDAGDVTPRNAALRRAFGLGAG